MSSLEAPRRSWHPATMITRYPDQSMRLAGLRCWRVFFWGTRITNHEKRIKWILGVLVSGATKQGCTCE